ncbi:glutamine--fructose-6-phosphate aminotransferase [isomerizing] [Spirochaetota bacterium]|nr:glutamine--fructose-6-phosphate aminotransferase [isomerizing] [Spirochaetota bacterium]
MCGIIGYVGKRDLASVLVAGLERLSYRGYDSSGIAVISKGELSAWKSEGKVQRLIDRYIKSIKISNATVGIGHTRWATHGEPTDINAHPQLSSDQKIGLVHNGIIENFAFLKKNLQPRYLFKSETDSEVAAHLIEAEFHRTHSFLQAFQKTLSQLEGTYALAIISEHDPQTLFAARLGSPLIIGLGEDENFIASDLVALIPHTRNFIYLADNEWAIISASEVQVYDQAGNRVKKAIKHLKINDSDLHQPAKGHFPHYMLKEIFDQPEILKRILSTYTSDEVELRFKSLAAHTDPLKKCEKFLIQACGTSWHAGLVAKYWLEEFAHISTEVDISSEFRYRKILARNHDILLALSQSGETADTLAGIREVRKLYNKLPVISFINRSETTMEHESDAIIPSLAGTEIGVASTKNYIAQLGTLFLFALYLGQLKGILTAAKIAEYLRAFAMLPALINKILAYRKTIKAISSRYATDKGFLFIGRGMNYPNALEGALKLKEISYLYAAGYAAGELKHGPIALIDENMPVIALIPHTSNYSKMMNNLEEVRSRKGRIIAIVTEGDKDVTAIADTVIPIPAIIEELSPLLTIIPLQLFAYDIAVALDRDVDQPKNLAKSVTVE